MVEGTDAHFQFIDTNIFGHGTRRVKSGKKLKLVIKANAPKWTHKYSVYCTTSPAGFATENSPPVIIIE